MHAQLLFVWATLIVKGGAFVKKATGVSQIGTGFCKRVKDKQKAAGPSRHDG